MSDVPDLQSKDITGSFAFIAFSAAAFLSGANLRLFDALLPSVAEDFNVTPATAAIVVTAFTFAYGLFQIIHGPLGDRLGKIRIAALATLSASAASLGSAFAPTLESLALLRFLTGVGVSAVIPMALAWIGDQSSYGKRQVTLGRFVGFLLLGQVLGPAFGGVLSELFSWREVFYGLAAAFLVVGLALLIESRRVRSATAVRKGNVIHEYLQLLKDRWVLTVLVTIFLEGLLFFGSLAYVGAYLQYRFDLSFALTGTLLAFYGIGGFLYSLCVRRLLLRMSERRFLQVSAGILLACFAALALLPTWQLAMPVLISLGFGLYMLHNTLQTKATEMAPAIRGTAIAVFAFSLFIGQAFGVTLTGFAISVVGYAWSFGAIGVLLLILARWFAARATR